MLKKRKAHGKVNKFKISAKSSNKVPKTTMKKKN